MTPIENATIAQLQSWIKSQQKNPERKILVIHDADGDGISAAKILTEGLQKLGIQVHFRFAAFERTNVFGDFLLNFISSRKVETVFTCDINLFATNFKMQVEKLQGKQFIVFDHHETPQQVAQGIPENVLYIHPMLTFNYPDPSRYCTSKLVYDVLGKFTDVSSLDWVASIGIVADVGYPAWKEFVDGTLIRLHLDVSKAPFDTELQKVGTRLYYGLAMERDDQQKAIGVYLKAKTYQEALQKLQGFEVVGGEIEEYTKNWRKYAEEEEDTIYIRIEPKYKIGSMISSQISFQLPSKTIILVCPSRTDKGLLTFSLRRQDGKVNLPQVLHAMEKEILGMVGGGHIQASGAKCKVEDYETFKKTFQRLALAQG